MDKQQAQQIIRDTFESSFDKSGFTRFIKNLLNNIENTPFTYQGNYIPDAYKQYIKTLERIGKYSDGVNSIDILIITLQKETSLERARTMQRNFIAWYLNGSRGGEMKDAALVAFVSPDAADWRFSLVKMDYKFEKTKTGRMKVKEEFTPARRWSFLVGANEKSHTAQSRLVNILANDEQAPNLEEIEKAFDIETVTKEFFLKYRELFLHTKEELDRVVKKDPKIKDDFEDKGVDSVNFTKKLLGQIVFLHFLQKKGWFGVGRDDDWGTGSKHFLRELFEKKHSDYNNFYNDILEPLFYEALRIDRSHDDDYYSRFNCKIPFLNGGLFDPIGNYDWVHTDIIIPDKLFSNTRKTKEGDTGDGILDIFDRYNFTVREDEPLEKEVAIDPELLGKAYEKFNAIRLDNFEEYKKVLKSGKKGEENKFNKKFGVYYTPREIVHYMCQQSLINYLHAELNKGTVSYQKVGESQNSALGNVAKKDQLDLTAEFKSEPRISKEDIENLIHIGEQVSENEARVINEGRETRTYSHKLPESIRSNAALINQKLEDITVCDPAVGSGAFPVGMMSEIVRARKVLSVFLNDKEKTTYDFKRRCIEHSLYGVDIDPGAVEIAKLRLWLSLLVDEDDINNIKPLPNLDYKVVCGNSLLGVEKDLFNAHLFSELEELKPLLFNETNPTRKQNYKKQIDDLISQITKGHKKFDFEVYFSEVFHKKGGPVRRSGSGGGFDVVIANPPYNELRDLVLKEQKRYRKSAYFQYARGGRINIFQFFYPLAITISKNSGIVCLITQNSILAEDSALANRRFIIQNSRIISFMSFPERDNPKKRVFESAKMSVCIGILKTKKDSSKDDYKFKIVVWYDRFFENGHILNLRLSEIKSTFPEKQIFPISSEVSFKILKKIKQKRNVFHVESNAGEIDMKKYKKMFNRSGTGYRVYTGAQILRYRTTASPSQGDVIYLDINLNKLSHKRKEHITNERIAMQRITGVDSKIRLIMTVIPPYNLCANSTNYIHIPDNDSHKLKYILSVLNSKLNNFYFKQTSTNTNITTSEINNIPIPSESKSIQNHLRILVDRILEITKEEDYLKWPAKQANVKSIEAEIDQLVYKLYDLTPEEIKIVEGSVK